MTDQFAGLEQKLDLAQSRGQILDFWWRDDDLCRPTAQSDRLFGLADEMGIPLALSIVPRFAEPSLADELSATQHRVWQHGYDHTNHDRCGGELGDDRDPDVVFTELLEGQLRLEQLFGDGADHVLVPPYGRIGPNIAKRLDEGGYEAVSLHGHEGALVNASVPRVDTGVDVLEWSVMPPRPANGEILIQTLIAWATAALTRPTTTMAAMGVLTHHLVLPEESWSMMRDLSRLITDHRGSRWVAPQELLASLSTRVLA